MVDGDLERAACEKALDEVTAKLPIKLFLSDRHRGVGVILRTKYPHIHHEFDVWHLSKSLLKNLGKAEKNQDFYRNGIELLLIIYGGLQKQVMAIQNF